MHDSRVDSRIGSVTRGERHAISTRVYVSVQRVRVHRSCAIAEIPEERPRLRAFVRVERPGTGEENRLAEKNFLRHRRGLGNRRKVLRAGSPGRTGHAEKDPRGC